MLYIIKFIYQWFLPPAIFIAIMAVMSVYMIKKKLPCRYVLTVLTVLLYAASLRVTADALGRPLETYYTQPDVSEVSDCDVILMLGNGSLGDVPDMGYTGQPSGTMGKNMMMTLRLSRTLDLPILISGGTVFRDTGNESDIAKREFIDMGVASDKIFCEKKSRNTVENIRFAKEICDEHGWQHPVLMVVALQAERTAMIAKREGMDAVIFPTHYRRNASSNFDPVLDLLPDAGNLMDTSAAIREYIGMLALGMRLQ